MVDCAIMCCAKMDNVCASLLPSILQDLQCLLAASANGGGAAAPAPARFRNLRPGDQVAELDLRYELAPCSIDELLRLLHVRGAVTRQVAGGSGSNSARMLAWLLRGGRRVALCSALGADEDGIRLRRKLASDGVEFRGPVLEGVATGRLAVLIPRQSGGGASASDRIIVRQGGAGPASIFKAPAEIEQFGDVLCGCRMAYLTAWFGSGAGGAAALRACELATRQKVQNEPVPIAFNLSGEAMCILGPKFASSTRPILQRYASVVFGNEGEFKALAATLQVPKDPLRPRPWCALSNPALVVRIDFQANSLGATAADSCGGGCA